jgi:hypothetical protein
VKPAPLFAAKHIDEDQDAFGPFPVLVWLETLLSVGPDKTFAMKR